jgi:NhaA family Na+:H+ antiporter
VVESYRVALFRSGLASNAAFIRFTAYLILPLFALFDAGVVIDSGVAKALADPVGLGVLFGPLIGARVGITAASWIVVRFGLAEMPSGVNSGQIHGWRF